MATPPRTPSSAPPPVTLLDSPVRRRMVELLAEAGDDASQSAADGLTAAQLASRLGLHTTTARFHLDQLEGGGLVESWFRRGAVGRPRKLYRLPRRPLPRVADAEGPLRALTALLTESWQETGDGGRLSAEEAGRRWALRHADQHADEHPDRNDEARPPDQARTPGAWLGKVGAALDLLTGWGYRPEVRTEEGGRTAELTLVDCPFLALAHESPDVVCGVHRGLLRGTLQSVGETDVELSLRPLVEPGVCYARVRTRAAFAPPHEPLT